MRVQQTRSSPSAFRSLLTHRPFGGRTGWRKHSVEVFRDELE
jgi:hypothetical protein